MPPVTIPQALELAIQHHEAGRLREAEVICRQILAVQDGERFARGIESAYRMMWRRWCVGGDAAAEVRR